ncbi:glycoside hydrolase family 43 protein [Herbiconiux ginsengi]|uniref:Glycosyl hydrolases family 43 n=1 Tax=Herbiconiux ginsengi TaxID=381665 RepID=A0A1H3LQV7_9MICO|nr:glycoside hydrolase family 43 protein [Herbiconiux ginsengi]SDY66358.1 Glycosyl hydrolases family 43 [Herbiconiux ginsengi]
MNEPIIAGFHPDPSICRVGDRYYLATSSFEYLPGVPVFTSTDLVNWELLGNALDRPSQLATQPGVGGASGGVYAPTLRHHDGLFWLVTTNIHEVARGHLIVHSKGPEGPWSEPAHVPGLIGIDPDLFWDESGVCHLTWSDVMNGGISSASIDPFTGAVLSTPTHLWNGTGGAHAEGPHLYSRDGWYYLLVAEGGTGAGHMVTVARSRSLEGPFEPDPANPILTHRSTAQPVQATGHADLVELSDGSWALVHLGVRPRGSFPRWHTNGRETFLAGIDWSDGWPVVVEDRFEPPTTTRDFVDTFTAPRLHPRWVSPAVHPAAFAHPGDGGLALEAGRDPESAAAERMLATRVEDMHWSASLDGVGDVALSVRIDDAHQAIVERIGDRVRARIVIGPLDQVLATATVASTSGSLLLRSIPFEAAPGARKGPDLLVLGRTDESGAERELCSIDGRYLSTEVAGGFTGRMLGMEALGDDAMITRFSYATPAHDKDER